MTNQNQAEQMDLSPFYGKFVAWNLSRTQILASGNDEEEVWQLVTANKLPLDQVIFSYIPHPDDVIMGGAVRIDREQAP